MKKQVIECRNEDWLAEINDNTCKYVVKWLKDNIPADWYLGTSSNYGDDESGHIYFYREETDAEYEKRLAEEVELVRWREAQRLLKEESEAVKMERLRYENVALHAYLELHKGHPKIGDLQNLFLAAMGLERQGAAATAINQLNECRERIENEYPN